MYINSVESALINLNISYDVFRYEMKNWDNDEKLVRELTEYINNSDKTYECIFSVNFIPMLSEVCNNLSDKGIKYISWVYDCPVNIRRVETMKNDCNTIYFFDRIQAEGHRKAGVNGARHMPLASDVDGFAETIRKYGKVYDNHCDVALVGKLYKSDYQFIGQYQDEYTRGYLEGIISTQGKIYGGYVIDDCINSSIMQRINENFAKASNGTYSVIKPEVTYALATEVTGRERYMILTLLQNRCKVNLYSTEDDDRLTGVNKCGPVDYYNQMPLIFNQAKINLNISLKVIQSGIPLRVFDVLACGGFLITNYQQEIAETFEDGKELVIYNDIPDLIAKVNYYLTHEEERKAIARNGYEKVKRDCTFEKRMKEIIRDI